MRYDIISSIIASVIAIILFLIAIAVILYEKQKKSAALNKKADEDWLFSNFQRSIYNLFFKRVPVNHCAEFPDPNIKDIAVSCRTGAV